MRLKNAKQALEENLDPREATEEQVQAWDEEKHTWKAAKDQERSHVILGLDMLRRQMRQERDDQKNTQREQWWLQSEERDQLIRAMNEKRNQLRKQHNQTALDYAEAWDGVKTPEMRKAEN